MKTLHIYIAILLLVILQSCQGCKEEIEPTPDYTRHCPDGYYWDEYWKSCLDSTQDVVDSAARVILPKQILEEGPVYVVYNSGYQDIEEYHYISFKDSLYIDWPQNPEQMYPDWYFGPRVNVFAVQPPEGPEGQTTFLDPVRGDSLIFHAPVVNPRSYYIRFEGRFSPDRTVLEGRIKYVWDWYGIARGYPDYQTLPDGWFPIRYEQYDY